MDVGLPVLARRSDLCRYERDPAQRGRRAPAGIAPVKFRPDPEQLEFAATLRELLASSDVPVAVRAWAAGDFGPGRKLWTRLDDLGLRELAGDPVGLVLAFEELGRAA